MRTVLDLLNERPGVGQRRGWSRSPVADVLAAHAGAVKILHTLRPGHCGDGGARESGAFKDSAANQIDQVTESTCAYWSGPSCAKTGLMFACSSTVHVSGYTIQR